MKYRVHLYVTVRVEQELEADSAAAAARDALNAADFLRERFDRPGQEYADTIDDWCAVDPLTSEPDSRGHLVPNLAACEWINLAESPSPNDKAEIVFPDEPQLFDSN